MPSRYRATRLVLFSSSCKISFVVIDIDLYIEGNSIDGDARSEPVRMFAKHLRSSSLERRISPISSLTYCIEKSYSILVIFECEKSKHQNSVALCHKETKFPSKEKTFTSESIEGVHRPNKSRTA